MSGTGLHIIAKGRMPGDRKRKGNVEIYPDGRFFTVTGNSLSKYDEINEPTKSSLKRVYNKYLKDDKVVNLFNPSISELDLSESEIIARIHSSKSRDKFLNFMNGGWEKEYSSQSEADLGFANMLAFWCGRDYLKMDSIFRQSSMMRQKWDDKHGKTTYGEGTLYKAINETNNVYQGKREPAKYDLSFLENKKEMIKEFPMRGWDDTGNADRFIDHFGDLARFSFIDKKWFYYNGSYWDLDLTGNVRSMVDAMVEMMKSEPVNAFGDLDLEEVEKEFGKHIKRSRSSTGKKAVVEELKHRLTVLPNDFDKDTMLMNTENGYVDLANGVLHEHDISKMFSQQANTEFTEKIDAPEWEQFLEDIFASDFELINYIQKAVGYSLTGSTREQAMFILHGNGRNGKSLFLETISDILGTYAKTMQANSIIVKQTNGVNTDIARLKGARLVTSSEPNEGFRLDEGLLKQLTGGDKVTARKLYGDEFEFNPQFKLWLATNHKPIVRGTDDGIWRRLILVPFNVQIPDHKVDKDLKYKLQREASGILNWAVDGCLKWQREGLKVPSIIENASKGYRNEMDVLEGFIADCLSVGSGTLPASIAYKAYKGWATDNNQYLMNSTKFGRELSMKYPKKRINTGIVYEGLQVKYGMEFIS
ncbi:MAG: phage/plasmid primase, P4 family [Sphingobacterium sp.]